MLQRINEILKKKLNISSQFALRAEEEGQRRGGTNTAAFGLCQEGILKFVTTDGPAGPARSALPVRVLESGRGQFNPGGAINSFQAEVWQNDSLCL